MIELEKIVHQEFNIDAVENKFRIANINAIQINAMATVMDLDDFEKTEKLYNKALEFIEVQIVGEWLPVRQQKGKDIVYWPDNIKNNIVAIRQLASYFIQNVIFKAFQSSSE